MTPERFEYFAPRSVEEALELLERHFESAKVLAGGQSLLAAMKLRLAAPGVLIDLNRIAALRGIQEDGAWLSIGAMTRYSDLLESDTINNSCPLLAQTIAVIADVQIRNRGTIGGAVAHADPAGDLPAAALALDAQLLAVSPRGERWIRSAEFFLGPYTTALRSDELLVRIRVPRLVNGQRSVYLKAARRPSDFAMVGVAAVASTADNGTCADLAVAITGVGDRVYRAQSVEGVLRGALANQASLEAAAQGATDGVDVASDVHASSAYRTHLTRVYVERALFEVLV